MKWFLRITKIITIIAVAIACFYLFKIEYNFVITMFDIGSINDDAFGFSIVIKNLFKPILTSIIIGLGILIYILIIILIKILEYINEKMKLNFKQYTQIDIVKLILIWIMNIIIFGTIIYIYVKMH